MKRSSLFCFLILTLIVCQAGASHKEDRLALPFFGEGAKIPPPLMESLQKKVNHLKPGESCIASYKGWHGYVSLLEKEETFLSNPSEALHRAEEDVFSLALPRLFQEKYPKTFAGFHFPLILAKSLLHIEKDFGFSAKMAPGAWKYSSFWNQNPWSILILPPESVSFSFQKSTLPSRQALLPLYRELCLKKGRKLRQKGDSLKSLPYYREWLRLCPFGPATSAFLEYGRALEESGELTALRELLQKLMAQREFLLTEKEKREMIPLWQEAFPKP